MILDPRNGDFGKLYDANGESIDSVIWADTESGEVVQVVKDANGRYVFDHGVLGPRTVRRLYPAPLKFEPMERVRISSKATSGGVRSKE